MADVQEKTCKVSRRGCIPRSVARVRKGGSLLEHYMFLASRLELGCFKFAVPCIKCMDMS